MLDNYNYAQFTQLHTYIFCRLTSNKHINIIEPFYFVWQHNRLGLFNTSTSSPPEVRPPPNYHYPMSVLYVTLSHLMMRLYFWSLGNVEYPFITLTLRTTLSQSGSTWSGHIYGYFYEGLLFILHTMFDCNA